MAPAKNGADQKLCAGLCGTVYRNPVPTTHKLRKRKSAYLIKTLALVVRLEHSRTPEGAG